MEKEKQNNNAKPSRVAKKAAKIGKKIIMFPVFLIAVTALFIGYTILAVWYVLALNPLSFYVWGLIASKRASETLRAVRDQGSELDFFDSFFNILGNILWSPIWSMRKAMPWKLHKALLEANQLRGATFDEEIRYLNNVNYLDVIEKGWLSREAKEWIWKNGTFADREVLIFTIVFTYKHFSLVLRLHEFEVIKTYIQRHTLSERMIMDLINEANSYDAALKIVRQLVCKDGLSTTLINYVYSDQIKAETRDVIIGELNVYNQKQAVSKFAYDMVLWRKYCSDLEEPLVYAAEILMNLDQYEIYRNHFNLSESAIIYFLGQQDKLMATAIIKDEIADSPTISERVKTMLNSNITWLSIFLKAQRD